MLKRALWIVVPLGALGALWLFSQSRPVPVDVGEVRRGPIRSFVEEEGKTRVLDRYVVAAPIAGRLARLTVEEDQEVAADEVLARIDRLPLESAVAEARAQVRALEERISGVGTKKPKADEIERARILEQQADEAHHVAQRELERSQATWERLVKDLGRTRQLAEDSLVPLADLDGAVALEAEAHGHVRAQEVRIKIAELAIAATRLNRTALEARLHDYDWEEKAYRQQIEAFQATLRKLEDDLAHAEIRAPVAGVVLRRFLESQRVVQAGTPILEIGDPSRLEVEADFLSEDVAHMKVGMQAEVFGRALGDRVLPGRVERIHPSAFEKVSSLGVEQQRVKVIVAFDAAETGLKDLFRVEVRVILEERSDVALVPEAALFRHDGAWHVFVVREGHACLQAVETGLRDGRAREALDGLAAGDLVVLHPGDALEDGAPVKQLSVRD